MSDMPTLVEVRAKGLYTFGVWMLSIRGGSSACATKCFALRYPGGGEWMSVCMSEQEHDCTRYALGAVILPTNKAR